MFRPGRSFLPFSFSFLPFFLFLLLIGFLSFLYFCFLPFLDQLDLSFHFWIKTRTRRIIRRQRGGRRRNKDLKEQKEEKQQKHNSHAFTERPKKGACESIVHFFHSSFLPLPSSHRIPFLPFFFLSSFLRPGRSFLPCLKKD